MTKETDGAPGAAADLFRGPILAPMVRAGFPAMRSLALKFGASVTYTDAVVASNILQADIYESKDDYMFVRKNNRVLQLDKSRANVTIVQLAGDDPAVIYRAARRLFGYCVGVDFNVGCMKEWTQSRYGGYLLGKEELLLECLRALRKATIADKMFCSCKIRLLDTNMATASLINTIFNDLNYDVVVLHARRVTEERERDEAHYGDFIEVFKAVHPHRKEEKLVYNGGILGIEENTAFAALLRRAEVDPQEVPIMLARGAVRNCSLFGLVSGKLKSFVPSIEVLRMLISEARMMRHGLEIKDYVLHEQNMMKEEVQPLELKDYAFHEVRCCIMFMLKEQVRQQLDLVRRDAELLIKHIALARKIEDLDAVLDRFEAGVLV